MPKRKTVNKIVIDLTDEQLQKLQPLFDEADTAWRNNAKGIVLGQVYAPNDNGNPRAGKFVFCFFPNEYAEQLVAVIKGVKQKEIK